MKINTTTRYGLRALIDIYENQKNGQVSIKDLAKRQNLSEKYLESIIARLRKNNLVESKIGKNGGYILTKPVDSITLYEVFEALEELIKLAPCVDENKNNCSRISNCYTKNFWSSFEMNISDYLKSKKLIDVIYEGKGK